MRVAPLTIFFTLFIISDLKSSITKRLKAENTIETIQVRHPVSKFTDVPRQFRTVIHHQRNLTFLLTFDYFYQIQILHNQ